VTAIKLPGRNENAHNLESAEIVACVLGVLAPLELMFCVAHAGKVIAATTGKSHFVRNAKLILPVLNNVSALHQRFRPRTIKKAPYKKKNATASQ
jgi:hypothetical protein